MNIKNWIFLGLLGLAACQSQGPSQPSPTAPPVSAGEEFHRLVLKPASFEDLPGWSADQWALAVPALQKSCDRIMTLPPDTAVGSDGTAGLARDWMGPCGAVKKIQAGDNQAAKHYFETWFKPWLATDNNKAEGLFTGYYEPEVTGSKRKHDRFTVPLYGKPSDLITVDLGKLRPDIAKQLGNEILAGRVVSGRLEPYANRMDIESNGLGDKAQVLFWLDDPVAAHILHIQGSGRIKLEDGSQVRVAVAATNGHRFIGLGRILADHGKTQAGSTMPQIREWLMAHPAEAKTLMNENPRYVFYRPIEGDGPIGSQGVALTAERSMAVDTRYVPLGVPLWLETSSGTGAAIRKVMVAQDTGTAIKGPVRGDVFWGSGESAFQEAGRMKSPGRFWLLLPRDRTPRIAAND
jgi:membrane-bound lytic murein transglycosylase A